MDESFWNFEGVSGMPQTASVLIFGMIRKESCILDHFEIFVTIAFNMGHKGNHCKTEDAAAI